MVREWAAVTLASAAKGFLNTCLFPGQDRAKDDNNLSAYKLIKERSDGQAVRRRGDMMEWLKQWEQASEQEQEREK
ncbi:hypothetical protein BG74_01885 [Sodalis-like endosymbiont of Proechinophthirus fluctus]|nr:hypothetical protein BG74_01885 [Sodalis-like endosymbiont of Proechinophthirus fluctus]